MTGKTMKKIRKFPIVDYGKTTRPTGASGTFSLRHGWKLCINGARARPGMNTAWLFIILMLFPTI